MRIAIISDIHSNLQALRKALSLIDHMFVDRIYCLGDIVGYGGNPNECVDIIREKAKYTVLGNHDHAALYPEYTKFLPPAGEAAAKWTSKILTSENKTFLSNLPYVVENEIAMLVHASPAFPAQWNYVNSLEMAGSQFGYFKSRICFLGHTHQSFVCRDDLKEFNLTPDGRFLINPGSIGQPRDGRPQLSFGIIDTDKWEYKNFRFSYNVDAAAYAIIRNKLPKSLADRLYKGR